MAQSFFAPLYCSFVSFSASAFLLAFRSFAPRSCLSRRSSFRPFRPPPRPSPPSARGIVTTLFFFAASSVSCLALSHCSTIPATHPRSFPCARPRDSGPSRIEAGSRSHSRSPRRSIRPSRDLAARRGKGKGATRSSSRPSACFLFPRARALRGCGPKKIGKASSASPLVKFHFVMIAFSLPHLPIITGKLRLPNLRRLFSNLATFPAFWQLTKFPFRLAPPNCPFRVLFRANSQPAIARSCMPTRHRATPSSSFSLDSRPPPPLPNSAHSASPLHFPASLLRHPPYRIRN